MLIETECTDGFSLSEVICAPAPDLSWNPQHVIVKHLVSIG